MRHGEGAGAGGLRDVVAAEEGEGDRGDERVADVEVSLEVGHGVLWGLSCSELVCVSEVAALVSLKPGRDGMFLGGGEPWKAKPVLEGVK